MASDFGIMFLKRMNRKSLHNIVVAIIPALLLLAACNSSPKYHAKGMILGETVNTTVDSEIARYYLENYLQEEKINATIDNRIDKIYERQNNPIPTRSELKAISKEYSVDFSALFLADRLWGIEENRIIQSIFSCFLNKKENILAPERKTYSQYIVLFVPGWDYVANGHLTGADFATPRKLITELRIENYLVDIPPHGSVTENANYLTNYLINHRQSKKSIIIVGASSAGPAIQLSLSQMNKKLPTNIKAWVNLGGILRGSPLIDYYQEWPQSIVLNIVAWHKGWDKEKIFSLSAKNGRNRYKRLAKINNKILVINYLGLSLSGQLSKYSKDKYPLLAPEGPNDGLTLLVDIIAPNSLTIIAPGSDHFFAEDPKINDKTIALTKVVVLYLEKNITKKVRLCEERTTI